MMTLSDSFSDVVLSKNAYSYGDEVKHDIFCLKLNVLHDLHG